MKTLAIALACIPFLAACKKEVPETTAPDAVVTAPVVAVPAPADTTTPAATMPAANDNMAPATTTMPENTMAPATTTAPSTSGSSMAAGMEGSGDGTYVVKDGDTLWDIADRNNIEHGDLAKWNNINDPRELTIGRKLRLTPPGG